VSQPRRHSLAEACVGTAVGFALSVAVQRLVFPWFGVHVGAGGNLGIAAIFTVVSIARGYAVRRFFARLQTGGRQL
jgi:hypothetical protein